MTLAVPEGGGHPLRAVTPPFYHRFTPVTSQFPKEEEILFAPLTGMELRRSRVEGTVQVYEVALTVNMASHTIEQVAICNP